METTVCICENCIIFYFFSLMAPYDRIMGVKDEEVIENMKSSQLSGRGLRLPRTRTVGPTIQGTRSFSTAAKSKFPVAQAVNQDDLDAEIWANEFENLMKNVLQNQEEIQLDKIIIGFEAAFKKLFRMNLGGI